MKITTYTKVTNKFDFKKWRRMEIKKGYYIDGDEQYLIDFEYCNFSTLNENYYRFYRFNCKTAPPYYLKLTFWRNIQFRYEQGLGWFQQKGNIMWLGNIVAIVVNIAVLILNIIVKI